MRVTDQFSDDDTSKGVCEAEKENDDDNNLARKRSATTHDPKDAAKGAAKKPRPKETVPSHIAKAIELLRAPLKVEAARIPDSNEHWLKKAVDI